MLRLPILEQELGICESLQISPLSYTDFAPSQWLIDLSLQLPSAQLDGFDISEDQFPSKAWLPSQISLSQLDITKDVPSDLQGKYDLVHVQLFLCVVQKDGPSAIIDQLCKLLSTLIVGRWLVYADLADSEPGGYLQWVEYDPISFKVVSTYPSTKRTANEKHVHIIKGPNGQATELVSRLFFSKSATITNH